MKPIYNRIITGLTVAALLTAVALVMFYPAEKKDYTIAVIGKSSDTGIEFWTAVSLRQRNRACMLPLTRPFMKATLQGKLP